MKHLAFWLGILSNVMFLNLENAIAETLLKGQVTLRDKSGEPVEHAQISAIIGSANPVSTNSDGVFELAFLDKQPGENVRFGCVKSGFEVANKLDLEQRLSAHPDDDIAQIVVCPSTEFMPCATAYYETVFGEIIEYSRQQVREKIEQECNEELRNAEKRIKDKDELAKAKQELLNAKDARIAELEEQNKGLQAQSAEWAKQFAEYDPATATDEMYKEALRLFQENKLDEAIAVLDDAKIQADLQRAQTQAANRYRLKAQSYVAKFDFANAEKYYQLAIDADPENFDNLHEFALYLTTQNQFLTARPLFEKALTLAKDDSDLAMTLGCLGILYSNLNEYEKTENLYNQSLKIYKELAAANPQTYRQDVATTLNNLGLLYQSQNDYAKAADAFARARAIYEELAAANPQTYRPDVAMTLYNFGTLYYVQNEHDKAADAYESALAIYKELAAANPQAYELDLCSTLVNLSYLYQTLYERAPQPTHKTEGLALAERAIGILQRYPNIPRAQTIWKKPNAAKPFSSRRGNRHERHSCQTP